MLSLEGEFIIQVIHTLFGLYITGNHKLVFGGNLSYMRRLIVFQEQLIHLKMSLIYMEMSVKITCIYANNFQVREIYSNMLGDIYTYNHQITCVYANNVTLAQLTTN